MAERSYLDDDPWDGPVRVTVVDEEFEFASPLRSPPRVTEAQAAANTEREDQLFRQWMRVQGWDVE